MTVAEPDERTRLLRAVERIALVLSETGIPRMPARVFAYVLAEDAERYTAAELAEGLRVSPGAISGAVRYLTSARLLAREREPGRRADHYRVYDSDVWGTIIRARLPNLRDWETALDDALQDIGTAGPGGRRLQETRDFYSFMRVETEAMLNRWSQRRARRT